jgi:methylglyoxal/glyoxal reductase
LLKDAEIKPMINQVEYHPRLTQMEVQAFCRNNNIQLEAWSPLMQGQLLDHPVLKDLANKYKKTVPQIILRWDLQNGVITIPKSTKAQRIIENSTIFDFKLAHEDIERINDLNQNHRVGPDPDHFDF